MTAPNRYDVTEWPGGDPHDDIGAVINSIVADIKHRQRSKDEDDGGRPGAVIIIPPGDYRLRTQAVIDVSYLRIEGAGHGFTSSSIRYNVPQSQWSELHELWPGGSRILVDLPPADHGDEASAAAFLVARQGDPRISSVEFSGFCIDGLHFEPDGVSENPENSYRNGRTGIYVEDPNDSFRISQMGMVYLEHAVTIRKADALSIHDNFIAECGSCIELLDWGQASKVTDNLIGAGPYGHSIYAENHGGLLIATNNVFPRGESSIRLSGVTRSLVSANRLHSFYPGVVILTDDSAENLVEGNHLLRDQEPWAPFLEVSNGRGDSYGIIHVEGSHNTIASNHVSICVDSTTLATADEGIVGVRLASGRGNYVSTTHVVARDVARNSGESAFEAQVSALLSSADLGALDVVTVQVDAASTANTVMDSGTEEEVAIDRTANAFRPTPRLGAL
ncbi:NosD domain-containing protein [Actinomyces slackii]|uniref:Inulin fructotransferase [DFA-I-forming] n=1 Tax=Actinomyces slackii TaxID=52774 RepID=A0A448KE59_9ACTO|nr:NosD domain-containing protein [Actinomyces slackii]VEG75178.1 Inulin fructotransferase [DFA-I-forming] [Actinomyces slackii]